MANETAWAKPLFVQFLDYAEEADRILHLCMRGLGAVSRMPALARALEAEIDWPGEPAAEPDPEGARRVAEAERWGKFAETEITDGFPALHSHAVIALWASLEVLVADLAASWLLQERGALAREPIARLKISVARWAGLDEAERMTYITKELSRSLNADFKRGVGQFEAILDAIGLAGPVDPDVRRTLLELNEVRNVLVHRWEWPIGG